MNFDIMLIRHWWAPLPRDLSEWLLKLSALNDPDTSAAGRHRDVQLPPAPDSGDARGSSTGTDLRVAFRHHQDHAVCAPASAQPGASQAGAANPPRLPNKLDAPWLGPDAGPARGRIGGMRLTQAMVHAGRH